MMDAWATFWAILFVVVLVVFAVLAVVIAIGGFFDVKALLKRMDEQHKDDQRQE